MLFSSNMVTILNVPEYRDYEHCSYKNHLWKHYRNHPSIKAFKRVCNSNDFVTFDIVDR